MAGRIKEPLRLAALCALAWLGCSDAGDPDAGITEPPPPPPEITVSEPVPDIAAAAVRANRAAGVSFASAQSTATDDYVHVSLPRGAFPEGVIATVRNPTSGSAASVTMVGGGFDPVPVSAAEGETLDIEILRLGGATVALVRISVPARRTPKVVRTVPPRGKTDVAVNQSIVVVFSEPISASSLSTSSVQLLQGSTAVPGSVRLLQGTGSMAAFTPDAPLNPNTAYRVVVTPAVRDLQGDALDLAVTATFTTGQISTGPAASLVVSPDTTYMTGLTYQLTATVFDIAGNMLVDQAVTWASSNPSGLTVSANGLVTALAEGGYTVTARVGNVVRHAVVHVISPEPPASITVSPPSATVAAGDTIVLRTEVRDASGRLLTRSVTWSSSDPGAVTVVSFSSGRVALVIGVSPASVTITATSGPASGTSAVTVTAPTPVASVTITPPSAALVLRQTVRLTATLRDATNRAITRPITWTTDNAAVATVDATGLVTGVGAGSTQVTATAEGVSDTIPVTVTVLDAFRFVDAGQGHSCVLDVDGAAYCWGIMYGPEYWPGRPPGIPVLLGSSVPAAIPGGRTFVALTSGYSFSCGLTATGAAYCWGSNEEGRLGAGSAVESSLEPLAVAGGHTFAAVTAHYGHACGVTTAGVAYCWGDNEWGELGNGSAGDASSTPVAVTGGLTFAFLSAGDGYTCGVTIAGAAYCWGANFAGQLGNGSTSNRSVPVAVSGGLVFSSLSAGGTYLGGLTCGVTVSGAAYCWGQLGDGSGFSAVPVLVPGGLTFAAVTTGGAGLHSCGVTTSGLAYCWGSGSFGQLGDGTPLATNKFSPVPVAVAGGLTFSSVTAGGWHTCGMSTTAIAYCWGAGGMLGDGRVPRNDGIEGSNVPVKVAGQP